MKINGEVKAIVLPLASMLLGAGVTYGIVSERVAHLSQDAITTAAYVRQIDQRLSRIEGALNIKVSSFNAPKLGIQNKE